MAEICFNSKAFLSRWFGNFHDLQGHVSNLSNTTQANLKAFSQQKLGDVLGDFNDELTKHRLDVLRHFCQQHLMLLIPNSVLTKTNEGKTFIWFLSEISTDPESLTHRLFHCVSREFGHVSTDWPDASYPNADMASSFGLATPQGPPSPALKMLDTVLQETVNVAFYSDATVLLPGTAGVTVKEVLARILH